MKQLTLFVVLFLLTAGARAATLSGSVTYTSTGLGLGGQMVYVRDSTYGYKDSTLTAATGFYSFSLPASVSYNRLVASTYACGVTYTNRLIYTGLSVTSQFAVCPGVTNYTIHGTVTLNGAANTGATKLYLIAMQVDSLLKDTTLVAIDSMTTSGTGTYTKTVSTISYLSLLIKAALSPSHSSYWSYVPTYYTSSQVWSGATMLTSSNFNPANVTNINMISGTNPGGSGFVGGRVLLGANKTAAVGDPMPNRIVILTNSSGVPLTYKFSDTAGRFSFSNLGFGTYKLFGDALGKNNPALTFTLTAAKPSMTNIVFEEGSNYFKGHLDGLGISSSTLSDVAVYPNPVSDHLSFTGLNNISGTKSIVLTDLTGSILLRQDFANGEAVDFNTHFLLPGMYLIHLQTEAGGQSFRVVK